MKQGAVTTDRLAAPASRHTDYVDLSPLSGPRFFISIDTEEEFDWDGPFARENKGVEHLSKVARFQQLCEEYGIKPTYMVDWPIIESAAGAELFGPMVADGKASLGLHLHPWVTPPFDEEVNARNSYACNLSPALERAKLGALYDLLKSRFGVEADIYRAGRYGAGVNTAEILTDLGITVDSSVRARFDYAAQHGPDFASSPVNPFWLRPGLIELPVTTVFGGMLRRAADPLFSKAFKSDMSRAILARAGLVERIALTPEGIPKELAIAGIDRALEEGIGILNFSFHSPSLSIGHTPYVRDADDLEAFYDWWHNIFAHLNQCGCQPVSAEEIAALAKR